MLASSLLVVSVAIQIIKFGGGKIGTFLSSRLLKRHPFNNPLRKKPNLHKWRECSWQLAIHISMTVFEVYVLSNESWWDQTLTCWIPPPELQTAKYSVRALYTMQFAIWIVTAFTHRFIEERRKDYVMMFIHHIATMVLLAISHMFNFTRIGVLVMYVHDMSDIFVDTLKMVNYLKLENKSGFFLSEIAYAVNLISWIYYRMWKYPAYIIYTAAYESHLLVAQKHPGQIFKDVWNNPPFWLSCNLLLLLLFILHIFWLFLFLRIGYKVIVIGAHNAGAEEYEGDSSEGESELKKKKKKKM